MSFDVFEWLKSLKNKSPYELPEVRILELARDYSGYVREAAVRDLARSNSSEALCMLLERLNDWVPQVRERALSSLESFLVVSRVPVLLDCLDNLLGLHGKGRADHSGVLERVSALLSVPEVRPVVLERLMNCRGKAARYLFERLCREGEQADLVKVALIHSDFTVRLLALQTCGRYDCEWSFDVLERLLSDPHFVIRREALHLIWQRISLLEARHKLLKRALLDSASSVREWAVWLGKAVGFDFYEFLSVQIDEAKQSTNIRPALLGLINLLRANEHIAYAQAALNNSSPAIRKIALGVVIQLSRDSADFAVSEALVDPSNKVARLAMRLLRRGDVALSKMQLSHAAEKALFNVGVSRAIAISGLMMIWDRLECLLMCLQSVGLEQSENVISALRVWECDQGRSGFSHVDVAQRARLSGQLTNVVLAAHLKDEKRLMFALSGAGLLPTLG